MIEDNVKQLKMANGDEVICEILEDLEDDLVVRYCLTIDKVSNVEASAQKMETFYVMRPWMTYIERNDELITLSKYHIMGAAEPNIELAEQYGSALKTILELADEEKLNEDLSNILKLDSSNETKSENVIKITSLLERGKNKLH
jgi:hypothetical protein